MTDKTKTIKPPRINKTLLAQRGGLSVREYARKIGEQNTENGYLPIHNLRSQAKRGVRIEDMRRFARQAQS